MGFAVRVIDRLPAPPARDNLEAGCSRCALIPPPAR